MTAPTRFKPHVTVATVIEDAGKFLMVQELQNGHLCFNQPAGHLEKGESLVQAAQRETLEESAWQIEVTKLIGIYHYHHDDKDYLRFCFGAAAIKHCSQQPLDAVINQALWLDYQEIKAQHEQGKLRSAMVLQCLNDYRAGKAYPLDIISHYESHYEYPHE